jgi:hypothetical protein
VPLSPPFPGIVTRYGSRYEGRTMACGGTYSSHDTTIAAVSLGRRRQWECGVRFEVCGAAGCLSAVLRDTCPGCGNNHLDLSEAGIAVVCGAGADICDVSVQPLRLLAAVE